MTGALEANAQLALDTIQQKPVRGIPTAWHNIMEHAVLERLARAVPGEYRRDPERVYVASQIAAGVCMLDQYIPTNPLTMGDAGFEDKGPKGATQGADVIVCDGIRIDGPEAVVEHLERFVFPKLREAMARFDEGFRVGEIVRQEAAVQAKLGPTILKVPYGVVTFPTLSYGTYGYEAYFSAYAQYPEVLERHFALQAELCERQNRAAARAFNEGNLPGVTRLDHDMADSRGTLVSPASLERLWFPHFERAIRPAVEAGIRLMWHCDGNLMQMVPRLIDCGISGFQGFQYEDGMDYPAICGMKDRWGRDLLIWAGVSVTRTLPYGTPQDVRRELKWLVEQGPKVGLFLGWSSSLAPGSPWDNVRTHLEGLAYYREHGRE